MSLVKTSIKVFLKFSLILIWLLAIVILIISCIEDGFYLRREVRPGWVVTAAHSHSLPLVQPLSGMDALNTESRSAPMPVVI